MSGIYKVNIQLERKKLSINYGQKKCDACVKPFVYYTWCIYIELFLFMHLGYVCIMDKNIGNACFKPFLCVTLGAFMLNYFC